MSTIASGIFRKLTNVEPVDSDVAEFEGQGEGCPRSSSQNRLKSKLLFFTTNRVISHLLDPRTALGLPSSSARFCSGRASAAATSANSQLMKSIGIQKGSGAQSRRLPRYTRSLFILCADFPLSVVPRGEACTILIRLWTPRKEKRQSSHSVRPVTDESHHQGEGSRQPRRGVVRPYQRRVRSMEPGNFSVQMEAYHMATVPIVRALTKEHCGGGERRPNSASRGLYGAGFSRETLYTYLAGRVMDHGQSIGLWNPPLHLPSTNAWWLLEAS